MELSRNIFVVLLCCGWAAGLCGITGQFQRVSPILDSVTKLRVCWNVSESRVTVAVEANVSGWIAVGFVADAVTMSGDVDVVYMSLLPDGNGLLQESKLSGFNFTDRNLAHSVPVPVPSPAAQLVSASSVVATNGFNGVGNDGVYSLFVFTRPLSPAGGLSLDPRSATGVVWATSFTAKPVLSNGAFTFPSHTGSGGTSGWWTVLLDNTSPSPTCSYYCGLVASTCGLGVQAPSSQFSSYAECLSLCGELVSSGAWSANSTGDLLDN
eukprot:TRINITY_DN10105_c0_g1_i1.p1 TRINITY_DN10105_c0_g1~~TRINITY_DN10105_c0_g1_i1.p1  ORF type:complete len:267 (+),score=70.98 TRINITY_DN10105_c0_g1_i1:138-938(+)